MFRIEFVSKLMQRWRRSKLLTILRGYRVLKASGRHDFIANLKLEMANKKIKVNNLFPSKFIFGDHFDKAEVIIRQYLLLHFSNLSVDKIINLNGAVLHYFGMSGSKFFYPLPREWREIFTKNNVKYNAFACSLFWNFYIFVFLFYGFLSIFKNCILILKCKFSNSKKIKEKYVYFGGLSEANLPQKDNNLKRYDIISWYMKWSGNVKNVKSICHNVAGVDAYSINNVSIQNIPSPIPYDLDFVSFLKYLAWAVAASTIALIDIFRGRWYHALMLGEASKLNIIRLSKRPNLAAEYMFGTTGVIYRPLWTYEAEKRKSRISFYFYSLNSGGWKTKAGYPAAALGWQPMTWPHYLVWDQFQADFVRREAGESVKISIVGPIWFADSEEEVNPLPNKTVAVFDVQPHRVARFRLFGIAEEYYVPRVANQFLSDIHSEVSALSGTIVLKRKRDIGKLLHPKYRDIVEKLSASENFISLDPGISALRVIEKCDCVISMPYTSPAILAREMGKPSIYYDPFGELEKDDRAAHGIKVISGPEQLNDWLFSLSEKSTN